ncbi:MAG: restriction endonuclease [Pseudomonadota bacterium]
MTRTRKKIVIAVAVSCASAVAACAPVGPTGLSGTGAEGTDRFDVLVAPQGRIDPDLVRAPEVFAEAELALWDGRRTARGIWVAHPKAARSAPQAVRIFNADNGKEVDAILYRPTDFGTIRPVTISSDAAVALDFEPNAPTQIEVYGLRPKNAVSQRQRLTVASHAKNELSSHLSRLDDNRLARVVGATMRGMGYATLFEDPIVPGPLPGVLAYPRPDSGLIVPALRVIVRPTRLGTASSTEVAEIQDALSGTGELGIIISLGGFTPSARTALSRDGAHVELIDREALLILWQTHYDRLAEPDRALLPLTPVYFLATD